MIPRISQIGIEIITPQMIPVIVYKDPAVFLAPRARSTVAQMSSITALRVPSMVGKAVIMRKYTALSCDFILFNNSRPTTLMNS